MESDQQAAANPEAGSEPAELRQSSHGRAECHPRLLLDDPVDEDQFGPRAHSRLVEAMCDLVDEEPGGKAVALIGTWGSGKSTVVRLLERRWSGSTTRRVFVFDAWAHQGDSLRRSFVEELADSLRAGWVKEPIADGVINDITGRTDQVLSESSPMLSGWGKLEALLIFLVPAGLVLLSAWLSGRARAGEAPDLWLWLGVGAILAPLLIASLLVLWLSTRGGKTKPESMPKSESPSIAMND